MTDLFNDAAREFTAATGIEVGLEYGSSGSLARKVEAGAPTDIYVSASRKWIDYTDGKKLLVPGSRTLFARNTLVFGEPVNRQSGITSPRDLINAELISIGDPEHVPAGQYAKQSLEFFDLWTRLMDDRKLVLATDVRAVLTHVQIGEVTGGIVYSTDAQASKKVRAVFSFPEDSHQPITYYAAVVASSESPMAAGKFIEFLGSDTFASLLKKYGFSSP
jgi:molybdate transport system substrate-binding protein